MAKRRAEYQLDRDGGHLEIEAELQKRDEQQSAGSPGLVSRGIEGRRIAKLRTNKFSSSASENKASASFGSNLSSTTFKTADLTAKTAEKADEAAKFKAININFAKKINQSIEKDPSCVLSKICEKYLEYAAESKGETAKSATTLPVPSQTPNFTFSAVKPAETKPTPFSNFKVNDSTGGKTEQKGQEGFSGTDKPHNPFGQFKLSKPASEKASITELPSSSSDSEDQDEDKKEVEIKGPQFTLNAKPTVKNPAFVFGEALKKKQAEDIDSDDSDVPEEPKGPTFNFSGTIKDSTFKFSAPKTEQKDEVKTEQKEETKTEQTAEPVKAPLFAFGAKKTDEPAKPEPAQPVFSFAKPAAEPKPLPAFSFKAQVPETTQQETKPEATKPEATKTFSFGANKGSGAPVFSFGAKPAAAPSESATTEAKTATFETKTTTAEAKTTTAEAKPVFSFNLSGDAPKKTAAVTTPAFSFGAAKETATDLTGAKPDTETTESKQKFVFNLNKSQPAAETSKPTFSFGTASSTATSATGKVGFGSATSFNFGKKSDDSSAASAGSETVKPQFSFNLPFNQNKTVSAGDSASAAVPQTAPQAAADETADAEKQEPTSLENNDEENENVLYTKKAKLMLFQPEDKENPYVTKGLGMFKILQSKEDKTKVRFLLRSEGMGNVILNTYVIPSITYAQFPSQPSAVKLPVVNAETKKIETFLLRVKTGDDGKDIVDVINRAKESMQ